MEVPVPALGLRVSDFILLTLFSRVSWSDNNTYWVVDRKGFGVNPRGLDLLHRPVAPRSCASCFTSLSPIFPLQKGG